MPGGEVMLATIQADRSLSAAIAQLVHTFDGRLLPEAAARTACAGFADTLGVIFAGNREGDEARIVDSALTTDVMAGAHLIPGLQLRSPAQAALINGTAAHTLDYDDVALDGHPSAVLVPAILAMAEEMSSPGRRLVDAYVIGYQVWGVLHARKQNALHNFGWHPTCVFGAISAAAACAYLARLSEEQTQHALGIAASLTSGLLGNFGSMTKPFQVGRAAEAGVAAARLAREGLTSSGTIFERSPGFFEAFYRETPPPGPPIDARWHIVETGLNIKRYPVCYCAQRIVDGVLGLARQYEIEASGISSVVVEIGDVQDRILRFREASSVSEAKFCAEFCVAAALIKGRLGLGELTMAMVEDAPTAALMRKVTRSVIPSTPGGVFAAADHVSIVTNDGQRFDSGPIANAKGSFEEPLTRPEMLDKFLDCLGPDARVDKAQELFDLCMKLDEVASVADVISAIGNLH